MKKWLYSVLLIIALILISGCTGVCSYFGGDSCNKEVRFGITYGKISVLHQIPGTNHLMDSDGVEYGFFGETDVNPYLDYTGRRVWFFYVEHDSVYPCGADTLWKKYIFFVTDKESR